MSYRANYRRTQTAGDRTALVTPRQMPALDKMAEAHGFTSGSALLADVASSTVAELGRQAFARYGRTARPRGRCEDAPCCGCCD